MKFNKNEFGWSTKNESSSGSGEGLTTAQENKLNIAYNHSKEEHFSGDYNDLTNKPTNVSKFINDANYASETYVNDKIDEAQLGGSGGNIQPITQIEPQELDMPKVFFYGSSLPTTKDNVNLTMDYISNTAKFSSFIKLKCQGTSSMSYAKKNFTVTMYSDEARKSKLKKDFRGWGAQSKFCLKANYVDTTHTRNLSGARIAYDMVQSRPDSPFKQQLLQCPRNGAVDGFPIKLYFNGEFYGIYTWNIPKDGWMFNMDEGNTNHMVLCAEKNNNSTNTSDDILRCEFRKEWDGTDGNSWSIEFGTYSDALKNSFNRCVNFVMTSTDAEFKANIGNYFDLYSLLDYYCFSYLVAHIDGLAKNMLMATYDGVIWGATLYDMDSIYGADWQGTQFKATNIQCPEQYQETNSLLWQRIVNCFKTELYDRYLQLRQGALSLSNIVKHVEEIYDVIPDRVFIDEKAKWTSLPGVNTNTITRFRNYMKDRAVYVDSKMLEEVNRVACTGITLSADTLSFTATDTQTLTATVQPTNTTDVVTWSVSPTGVVTVNNGVVTPVANGNCTITATCGSQSVTCNVTVSGIQEITEYTYVDYIEGSGTQYINTNVIPTVNTKFECVINTTYNKMYAHLFGSDNFIKAQYNSAGQIFVAKKNASSNQLGITDGAKVTYKVDMSIPNTTSIININGTDYTHIEGSTTSTNYPLLILCGYNNKGSVESSYCASGKIYSFKIYEGNNLIRDMKPVINRAGVYGLLDTVNNTFYASEVGSFTGGGTPGGGDTAIYATAEYAITEPRTFNGTSDYIDTGIKLFDTAKTFSLFVDYATTTPTPSDSATIFHCLHEVDPSYRGLCLMETRRSNDVYFIGGQLTGDNYVHNLPSSGKCLIEFIDGVINKVVTIDNSYDNIQKDPYVQISENLLIGCYQDASGTKGRYWSGTINKFGVWYKQLTSEEKETLFGTKNLLEGVSWSANADNGIYTKANQGVIGTEKGSGNGDSYLSGQIPCSKKKYILSNINGATFLYKEMYVYASDGTFLGGCYSGGKYNTDGSADDNGRNVTMDLRNIQEEPAYMRITVFPNNVATNNDPANQLRLIAFD